MLHRAPSLQITTGTPEYKAIWSCRNELTQMLSTCYKEVAEYLHQSGALTDKQCQAIIGIQNQNGAAEIVMGLMIDVIEAPAMATTLDSFAKFVTAMKKSGNKHLQTFVKEKIESKRKELYRGLLRVPAGM